MNIRDRIRSLTFHDGKAYWDGCFNEILEQWTVRFRLELHGDRTRYGGVMTGICNDPVSALAWDETPGRPPGDERSLAMLEGFVGAAFRESVHMRVVIEPVNMDEVESRYLLEKWEE